MRLGGVSIVEADPAYNSKENRRYTLSHGVKPIIGINPRRSSKRGGELRLGGGWL